MAQYGTTNNFHPGNANAPVDGTLLLTYTIGSTSGSFTYQGKGPSQSQQGPWTVTFTSAVQAGVADTGTATMPTPGLHVPGHGQGYSGATFNFTAPNSDGTGGSLTGTFTGGTMLVDLSWSADGSEMGHPKGKPQKAGY